MLILSALQSAGSGGVFGGPVPTNSLEFDGSTDYLSMSNANFGAFNRSKFAIAGSFYANSFATNNPIIAKDNDPMGTNREFFLDVTNANQLLFQTFDNSGSAEGRYVVDIITFVPNTWYAYLVYFDIANPTASERMRIWINNSEVGNITVAPVVAPPSSTADITIGAYLAPGTRFDGLIYQPTFFSGSLPAPADVFDGTSGALKNLSGLTGVYSLLDASTATNDVILSTDWTNNGTVTTGATIPTAPVVLPPENSLEFDGSTDYLSMSDANFGELTNTKFAVAGAFNLDDLSVDRAVLGIYTAGGIAEFRLWVDNPSNQLRWFSQDASNNNQLFYSTTTISTSTWYSFLIHYDSANATTGDRIRMWINSSEETASSYTAPTAGVRDSGAATTIGYVANIDDYWDGLLYQISFFDNVLPDPADVFNGSSGKLKDLSGLTGVYSLLDASTATNDVILATDWTNNGTVTTSATTP